MLHKKMRLKKENGSMPNLIKLFLSENFRIKRSRNEILYGYPTSSGNYYMRG